jgi:hypothetical protein
VKLDSEAEHDSVSSGFGIFESFKVLTFPAFASIKTPFLLVDSTLSFIFHDTSLIFAEPILYLLNTEQIMPKCFHILLLLADKYIVHRFFYTQWYSELNLDSKQSYFSMLRITFQKKKYAKESKRSCQSVHGDEDCTTPAICF